MRPRPGFQSCGDAHYVKMEQDTSLFCVIDALGHGPDAQKSAQAAKSCLEQAGPRALKDLFDACDKALKGIRGAVMSMVRVEPKMVRFAGIGNVDVYGPPGVSRPTCVPGILGRGIATFREFELFAEPGHRWVLVSDGLKAREMPKALEAAQNLSAVDAAKALLERAARPDDDACVVVIDFREKR